MNTHTCRLVARCLPLLCAVFVFAAGCRLPTRQDLKLPFSSLVFPHNHQPDAAKLFQELGGEKAFTQLTQYLYRWYLDETDFKRFNPEFKHQLWIRIPQTVADPQDKSRYLEVVFPAMGVMVTLKKTDYQIPELKLAVKNDGYRVTQVCRDTCRRNVQQSDYAVMDINIDALYERLFKTRLERVYYDAALLSQLKESAQHEIAALHEVPGQSQQPHPPETLYVAPVNTLANEIWCFWEEGKMLLRFTSDIDLSNPELWTQESVTIQLYSAVEQTVVSHEERPGDARFITRDQIARALFNCIILGQKISLPNGQN